VSVSVEEFGNMLCYLFVGVWVLVAIEDVQKLGGWDAAAEVPIWEVDVTPWIFSGMGGTWVMADL
jgi:hypothetical protein